MPGPIISIVLTNWAFDQGPRSPLRNHDVLHADSPSREAT